MRGCDLYIDDLGIQAVYQDDVSALFDGDALEIRRASHVEPDRGGWSADLVPVGGPVLGPFRLREEALAAEVRWLSLEMAARRLDVRE